jgi:hypothetical protein
VHVSIFLIVDNRYSAMHIVNWPASHKMDTTLTDSLGHCDLGQFDTYHLGSLKGFPSSSATN